MCKARPSASIGLRISLFAVVRVSGSREPLVLWSESQLLVKQDQFVSARNLDIIMGLCMANPHGIN